MFLVITIIILQLLGKLMGLWRLHTTNWLRDNGFSQGPGFTVHNVGFKEISVQFYSELYNKRISSYSYSWDHMGLKSLPKLSKSEQMKTPCFLLKKWTEIHQKLTLCTRRGWLVWSCLRAAPSPPPFSGRLFLSVRQLESKFLQSYGKLCIWYFLRSFDSNFKVKCFFCFHFGKIVLKLKKESHPETP